MFIEGRPAEVMLGAFVGAAVEVLETCLVTKLMHILRPVIVVEVVSEASESRVLAAMVEAT